jgi:hypothetical protein
VIKSRKDKEWFLLNHPLQKFYGGENAFTSKEYRSAMLEANMELVKEYKYFDSIINFFPNTKEEIDNRYKIKCEIALSHLNKRIGILSRFSFIQKLYFRKIQLNKASIYDENLVPGRMYSYLCVKK